MSDLHLIIGNKNYSSWSMRPWLAMTVGGLSFQETVILLDQPDTAQRIREHTRSGRVPVLHHGDITVWESLAIIEYVAETFPGAHIWPTSAKARAVARAVSNEMHAGFAALRRACPMNLRRPRKTIAMDEAAKADVNAIQTLWRTCRNDFGQDGPFLFGNFSGADAMFAPVVTRFDTYDIHVDDDTRNYMQAVMDLPAFQAWRKAGLEEPWRVPSDEAD
jgi:glutathione S-transferase